MLYPIFLEGKARWNLLPIVPGSNLEQSVFNFV
jgi:hypothetical protein